MPSIEEGFIHTKEKAKVVAVVLGTEFHSIPCRATAVLHQDDMKKRMNSFIYQILKNSLLAWQGIE